MPIADCYSSVTVSSERWQPGARRVTPLAAFVVLAGLLLLVLSLPCPHGLDATRSAQPITSAAGLLHGDRTAASCPSGSGILNARPRTADYGRPDNGGTLTIHAPSVDEGAGWALPALAAIAEETYRPHGRALLALLGIERK